MRVAYETMLAEFERVLNKYGFSRSVPTRLPRSLHKTVWQAYSATA